MVGIYLGVYGLIIIVVIVIIIMFVAVVVDCNIVVITNVVIIILVIAAANRFLIVRWRRFKFLKFSKVKNQSFTIVSHAFLIL